MTGRSLVPPQFAIPPTEYRQTYFADVIRAFGVFVDQTQQPSEGRATTFVMTNLPDNDSGLEVGGLFQSDGFVKITRAFNPHPAGVAGTASVGSVTVLTP